MRAKKHIYFLSICLVLVTLVSAQYDEKNFVRYSVKDGLSDNSIQCIRQDDQGYLWIGTDAGLNRFDGRSFKNYFQGSQPLELPYGSIWNLKSFGPDLMGIITRGGFLMLNTKNYSRKKYMIPDTTAFRSTVNVIWDVVELPGKSYAVSSATGFYIFNQDGQITLRHDAFTIKDVGKKRILYGRDIYTLAGNKYLVFINEDRVGIYDHNKKIFEEQERDHPVYADFIKGRQPDTTSWIVKYQLDANRYLFIPLLKNKIVYYELSTGKKIVSALPLAMTDDFNWESHITRQNDSTFMVNSRRDGFYVLQLDRKTGIIRCSGEKFLKGHKILSLFIDKDQRLWAGTMQGLLKQEMQTPVISAIPLGEAAGAKYTGGFVALYHYKNKLYAGRFSRNKGLAIMDPETLKVLSEVDLDGGDSPWNEVRSIEMYHTDTLWLGTNGGIIWYDTKTGRFGKLATDPNYAWTKGFLGVLAPARPDGYAWMCSMLDGKVARYHIPTRTVTLFTGNSTPALPFEKVKHIVYDSYGDVWIGGHSLTRFNNRLQAFDTLITVYGGVNKFNDDIIALRADSNGSLWMHNAHNGLLEYRIRDKKYIAYTVKDGLASDIIAAMSPVIDQKLWIAGNNRLTLMDTRTRQFTIYDSNDGFPEERPNARRIYFDESTGLLYLFTNEHLVRFPYLPERKKDMSSELVIEEIRTDKNNLYQPGEETINFPYHENNITIDYSIIDFEKSNYQFAWRLDDEAPWNVVGQQRSIILNNLSPGKYNIQIKASGKPGVSKTKTVSFRIASPFWKTPWFFIVSVLTLAGCGFLLYRRRIRNIRQKANIDKMLSKTEMKALQAQMNPHFIFNSLNSIREMILNNENKEASTYLSKFAHLIRITLDQSTQSLVSLRATEEYLRRYMEMEKIRNNFFTYEINSSNDLDPDDVLVPPMLIQPFIENALWHGVSASDKKIHVKISFSKQGETLICKIDDDGIGIEQSQKNKSGNGSLHRSHGIANIRTRVNLLNEKYNLKSRFTIEDKKEKTGANGTLVTLHLPIEIKES